MADATDVKEAREEGELIAQDELPEGVAVFEVNGPLFYGVALSFNERIYSQCQEPKVLILRFHNVPLIDASGIHALEELSRSCKIKGIKLLISGMSGKQELLLRKTGIEQMIGKECLFKNFQGALAQAKEQAM